MSLLIRIQRAIAKHRIKWCEDQLAQAGKDGTYYIEEALRLRDKYGLENWERPIWY